MIKIKTGTFRLLSKALNSIAVSIFIVVFVAGCQSTNNSNSEFSKSELSAKSLEAIELNKAIKARGFYKTNLDNINYLNEKECGDFELQSHRGSVYFPENSLFSIIHALDNEFNVVEIDVRTISDGTWIVHHDAKTGRATGTVNNEQQKISRLSRDDYGYLRHRNMNTGLLTDSMPPSFSTLAANFGRYSSPNQKLNIEIKSDASESELEILDYIAFTKIGQGKYFYSSLELDNLVAMRRLNPDVYVALIQNPSKTSMNILAADLKKGAGTDPVYLRHKEELERYQSLGNRYARFKRYDNKTKDFLELRKKLGSNYGLNIDIRHFNESFNTVMSLGRQYGVPIGTYTINGHQYHERSLLGLSKGKRPDTVIIDDTVYGFCTSFGLPKQSPIVVSGVVSSLVASLPFDLDLEKIDMLLNYEKRGIYPSIDGRLKSFKINSDPVVVKEKVVRPSMEIGTRQNEEDFSLDTGGAIDIDLRSNKDKEKVN